MEPQWGRFSEEQQRVIKPFIRGRVIYDLGCGQGHLSVAMAKLGAKRVVAVDGRCKRDRRQHPKVEHMEAYFHEFDCKVGTALVSWPLPGGDSDLAAIVSRVKTVIYLGCNLDGRLCGTPRFWDHVTWRSVLAHVPHKRNTLIVYGGACNKRDLLPEEQGAMRESHIFRLTSAAAAE